MARIALSRWSLRSRPLLRVRKLLFEKLRESPYTPPIPDLKLEGLRALQHHPGFEAVIAFQKRAGLTADGLVGKKTKQALAAEYAPNDFFTNRETD